MRIGALVLAVLLLAGCGGSSRLSRAELVRETGKICGDQTRAIAQIPRGPATALNAAGYLGAVLSVVEKGVRRFHALHPPSALEPRYRQLRRELDRNADILRTLRAAAAANDRKDYERGLSDLHRSRERIDALERGLGLTGCSSAAAGSS
jgi:hypothetical protein